MFFMSRVGLPIQEALLRHDIDGSWNCSIDLFTGEMCEGCGDSAAEAQEMASSEAMESISHLLHLQGDKLRKALSRYGIDIRNFEGAWQHYMVFLSRCGQTAEYHHTQLCDGWKAETVLMTGETMVGHGITEDEALDMCGFKALEGPFRDVSTLRGSQLRNRLAGMGIEIPEIGLEKDLTALVNNDEVFRDLLDSIMRSRDRRKDQLVSMTSALQRRELGDAEVAYLTMKLGVDHLDDVQAFCFEVNLMVMVDFILQLVHNLPVIAEGSRSSPVALGLARLCEGVLFFFFSEFKPVVRDDICRVVRGLIHQKNAPYMARSRFEMVEFFAQPRSRRHLPKCPTFDAKTMVVAEDFAKSLSPSDERLSFWSETRGEVDGLIQSAFDDSVDCKLYGSVVNGFGVPHSDIDIVVFLGDRLTSQYATQAQEISASERLGRGEILPKHLSRFNSTDDNSNTKLEAEERTMAPRIEDKKPSVKDWVMAPKLNEQDTSSLMAPKLNDKDSPSNIAPKLNGKDSPVLMAPKLNGKDSPVMLAPRLNGLNSPVIMAPKLNDLAPKLFDKDSSDSTLETQMIERDSSDSTSPKDDEKDSTDSQKEFIDSPDSSSSVESVRNLPALERSTGYAVVAMRKLGVVMEVNGWDVLRIEDARVPIIQASRSIQGRFGHDKICVDISFNHEVVLHNSRMLLCYSRLHPIVKPLCQVVKWWAKYRELNEPWKGTLSSYAYVIMVIYYLQQRGIIPSLQTKKSTRIVNGCDVWFHDFLEEKINPATLCDQSGPPLLNSLFDFFYFYAYEFNFYTQIISIKNPSVAVTKAKFFSEAGRMLDSRRTWLAIEDPFENGRVLGNTAKGQEKLSLEIRMSVEILAKRWNHPMILDVLVQPVLVRRFQRPHYPLWKLIQDDQKRLQQKHDRDNRRGVADAPRFMEMKRRQPRPIDPMRMRSGESRDSETK